MDGAAATQQPVVEPGTDLTACDSDDATPAASLATFDAAGKAARPVSSRCRPAEIVVVPANRHRRSPTIVVGALLAVASLLIAGRAGGASSNPRWLTAADPTAAASRHDAELAPDTPTPASAAGATAGLASGTAAGAGVGIGRAPGEAAGAGVGAGRAPGEAAGAGVGASSTTAAAAPGTSIPTTAPTESTAPARAGPVVGSPPTSSPGAGAATSAGSRAAQPANRSIPGATQDSVPAAPAPPWAASVRTDAAGFVTTNLGCASGTSATALGAFFGARIGPVMGMDYQHVYPLGGRRYLWLFQDMFIDQSGAATQLGQAAFVHNAAMVQDGACFTLYTRGTATRPASFEQGTGESVASTWFWPMGGELVDGQLRVFWVEMHKDPDPGSGDGLGWHPTQTWLATYSPGSLAPLDFRAAPNAGASPIYGYAVASDGQYTYLFGNTFEQDLDREGGYGNGPHSATKVFLARVPDGELDDAPEYFTAGGWSADATQAQPISQRYWVENPMQPRFVDGQWVAVTKIDGYWGEQLAVDVANQPWGPWTTTDVRDLTPHDDGDASMNTYQAHLMPWLDADGRLLVSYSQNARDMLRDAWPHPERYRPAFTTADLVAPPADEPPTTLDSSATLDPSDTDAPSPTSLAPAQRGDTTSTSPASPATAEPSGTTPVATSTTSTATPTSTTSTPATSTTSTATTTTATSTTSPATLTTSTATSTTTTATSTTSTATSTTSTATPTTSTTSAAAAHL